MKKEISAYRCKKERKKKSFGKESKEKKPESLRV